MKKVNEQPKRFLPNNCRPSYTGQGLSPNQIKFFGGVHKNREPISRTMTEIAQILFRGDYWAANHFQNKFIADGVLEILPNGTIALINWD